MIYIQNKLKLYGFNNLTKSLSFNIYDICYAKSEREQRDYIAYIDSQYNSERLTNIMYQLTKMIGAQVLSVSNQDYDPQGASVTFLVAEQNMRPGKIKTDKISQTTEIAENVEIKIISPDVVLAHLDKSHITVHTYPEFHPETSIATFRVDIDISTCGEITPLSTLDFLIGSFESDIITMDYRVRGFTRDVSGKKIFNDGDITSVQDFIDAKTLEKYDAYDLNVYQSNIFHTKLLIKDVHLQNYLFNSDVYELEPKRRLAITNSLRQEMIEIFSGVNVYTGSTENG
ncbi:MAG: adenosylmethionine decarboxylase [Defluviitaleaceae bacterium]|nr:adenosylmethionine decarboxylase [Defluviitaleaceae bacterium]